MKKVVTFGEILLRLSTERHLRFSQATNFNATYGGGEFNVAVSLANFGIDAEFVTRLPKNDIGDCALKEILKYKVAADHVQFGGDRLGIYFLETGAGTRGSKVIYDRENSAIANIEIDTIDWESVFGDAQWFHWSGVTPAISSNAAAVCLEAVKMAHKMGLTISSDLNYRSKLWKYGKEPKEVMPELLQYSHVILGDLDTAFFMTGKEKKEPDYQNTASLPTLYDDLFDSCPDLKFVATTLRYSVNASHQKIGGILYDGKTIYNAEIREVTPVVDRVGSGDAFMGGLIYSLLQDSQDKQQAINFAAAACCLKHTISGDFNLATLEEISQLAAGDSSGKVSR
ncbi:5-dehydro-2-deoxygluconokinase [Arenibacter antarcticus]|uniref:PfkB family carbohydrate kinase n=1 Tax=Arenibacter antarcticus TaxID=2040469 RepID=A0ABW5VFZ9_9FLAO|nr:sugar kinase [Arenibacter sp. H213]MCM4167283.1 2-dehydro-3-deoxygluconokinase [Arenibacter sp. H213]